MTLGTRYTCVEMNDGLSRRNGGRLEGRLGGTFVRLRLRCIAEIPCCYNSIHILNKMENVPSR